jgi:hypothetical protein
MKHTHWQTKNRGNLIKQIVSGKLDQEIVQEMYKSGPREKIVDELSDTERKKLRRCYYGDDRKTAQPPRIQ